jgi:hypothetical protein
MQTGVQAYDQVSKCIKLCLEFRWIILVTQKNIYVQFLYHLTNFIHVMVIYSKKILKSPAHATLFRNHKQSLRALFCGCLEVQQILSYFFAMKECTSI